MHVGSIIGTITSDGLARRLVKAAANRDSEKKDCEVPFLYPVGRSRKATKKQNATVAVWRLHTLTKHSRLFCALSVDMLHATFLGWQHTLL